MQPELLSLALDAAADPALRARAVTSLGLFGDASIAGQMLPLAKGEIGPDPQDDIRGNALHILWPDHLTARELFSLVVRPNDAYVGSYVVFLTRVVPDSLTAAHLPEALAWADSYIATAEHMNDFHRKSLAGAILVRGWKHMEDPGILEPLMSYMLSCMHHGGELYRGTDYEERDAFLAGLRDDTTRRRKLIIEAARRPLDKIGAFYLQRPGILQRTDLRWILTLAPGGPAVMEGLNEDSLLNLVETLFQWEDAENFEAFYDAALIWPRLRDRFSFIFDGVPLDSPDAQQLRKSFELSREWVEKSEPLVDPSPAERIAMLLERFEAGDWNAWWQLNRELTLTPTSRAYGSDLNYAIVSMPGWQAADEPTKQRILDAADHYLTLGETSVSEWIGTNQLRLNDLAAFRALILLKEIEGSTYSRVSPEIWAKWAPTIAALPRGDTTDKSSLEAAVIADALAAAPNEFVQAVRHLIQTERQHQARGEIPSPQLHGASFFVLRQLDGCWDSEPLKEGVFEELRDPGNTEGQFVAILEPLLMAQFARARDYACAMLGRGGPQRYAMEATVCLAKHCVVAAWPAIWPYISTAPQVGRDFFLKFASYYSFPDSPFVALDEQQIAELYVLMEQLFPRSGSPQHLGGRAHMVSPLESVAHIRESLPGQIVRRGTPAAVQAMRWIIGQLPGQDWLTYQLREAEQVMRATTWAPLTPVETFRLTQSRDRLLVRSAQDLSDLLIDTLRKYEAQLHGELTPIRELWDRQADGTFRPIEEDSLSNNVSRFLRHELTDAGIVANREVEIVRRFGPGIGSRTDIRINALRRSSDGTAYDVITAVIETKGNWHSALFTALNDQLYAAYLVPLQAPVGIYLVGWFDKTKWDQSDPRRKAAPDDLHDAQNRLDAQAASIPAGYVVRAVIVDCHAL